MRSAAKKIIGGVIGGILATTAIIALIPVFMYGFAVPTVTINYSPLLSMFPSPSSSDDSINIDAFDFSSYQLFDGPFKAEQVVISPYAYLDVEAKGNFAGSGTIDFSNLPININVLFYLTITNPLGESVTYVFTLEEIAGDLTVDIVLGPNEIQILNGTYQLSLFVEFTLEFIDVFSYTGNLTIDSTVDVIV